MWFNRQNASRHQRRNRGAGFTLIEALVALLVLATGLIVMANFQATMTSSSIDAKARAEAMQLAQQRMEWLRARDLVELANGSGAFEIKIEGIDGRVAEYTLSLKLEPKNQALAEESQALAAEDQDAPLMRAATVLVEWESSRGEEQWVELVSYVAANAYAGSVNPGSGVEFSGGSVAGPGGGARMKQYDPDDLPSGGDNVFGNIDKLQHPTTDGKPGNIEFINMDTGEAIEILSPHRAAFIAGTVYVRTAPQGGVNLESDDLTQDVFVRATPISLCGYDKAKSEGDFEYYPYRCYLAASDKDKDRDTFGWYGNIGILHPAASNQDGVCVGSLTPETAIPASVRQYRGYETRDAVCEDDVQNCGTAVDDEGRPLLFPVGITGEGDIRQIEDHNFLVARIGPNPSAADCAKYMAGAPRAGSNSDPFNDNPPEFFCFSDDAGLCPDREFGVAGPDGCSMVGAVCDATGEGYHGMVYAGAAGDFYYFTSREDEPRQTWSSSATRCEGQGWFLGGAREVQNYLHLNLEAFRDRPDEVHQEDWALPLETDRFWTSDAHKDGGLFVEIVGGTSGTANKSDEYVSRCLFTAPREASAN
ncbi:prepilin-type N-terminal cleavage/methylation domain-containing protein [Thioalkalivibrio sp.]|uniref:type IV pilus modification PilV family protein n=1 Tax=Thioalkalivibrio sp. TaxID=2093813 RepID=UPI0012D64B6C|nr:prepilin-type N-terminal cleavage/methylation domain-containing protein [Thioalkalivibrio sp.]TVP81506.1 MAG: hypothetical protein EA346_04845 [Thioalkalivibrio sp.]